MRWVRRLTGAAIVVAGVLWIVKLASINDAIVPIRYVFGVADLPLWQGLLGAFGAGFALASGGWLWSVLRASLVQRRYRKAVSKLESQVHELRNLPLAPGADSAPEGRLGPGDTSGPGG